MTSISQEKQLLLYSRPGVQIELKIPTETQSYVAAINPCELSRVISNLLNNSIEALENRKSGKITLSLEPVKGVSSFARIVVEDNGIGMSRELLEKMRQIPHSFGKVNGHGLGLRHAQKVMQKIGTFAMIDSELGVGTKIILAIPLLPRPTWLEDRLSLQENDRFIVLDDDDCAHELWKKRLELIEKFNLKSRALLVTSSFDDQHLQRSVEKLGIKMMPKFLIQNTPIDCNNELAKEQSGPDLILINDEDFVSEYWALRAESLGKKLLVVSDETELDDNVIRPSTPVYIHKTLKGIRSGIEMARTLYNRGFSQLFLTTGDPNAKLDELPFLKGIVGKSFPLS